MRAAKSVSPLQKEAGAFLAVRWRAIAVLLLVTLPWWIAVTCPLTAIDDPLYIASNEMVLRGLSAQSVRWAFATAHGDFWLPMTWLSLMLDATLFGNGPMGFHAMNVALHIANCVLLYELLRVATRSPLRSLLVAVLFAVHPLRVESVAWVTERKDVLSAFFGLLALLAYVRYAQAPRAWKLVLACAMFALSVMAKPMLVALPAVLLLMDFWPLQRWGKMRWWMILAEKIPFVLMAGAISVMTYAIQHTRGVIAGGWANPLSFRVTNAFLSVAYYLRDTFYFADLSVYYPRLPIPPEVAFAAVMIVLGISGAVLWGWWKTPARFGPVAVGWFWFLIALLPALGIVQSGGQSRADRFTYFPSIGLFVALVWAWPIGWLAGSEKRRMRLGLAAAVVGVLMFSMTVRLWVWRDPLLLYADGIAHTSKNWYLETIMGDTYKAQRDWPAALDHYEKAADIVPGAGQAQNSVGLILLQMGRLREAVERFHLAHLESPHDELYANNYNEVRKELARRAGAPPATAGSNQEHP